MPALTRQKSTLFQWLAVPSAELEAGGRVEKHSNGMPRICWHTILTCGNPQWYDKPLKQR